MDKDLTFYRPTKKDGWQVAQLIRACPPLDNNSVYCNLLQCHHFADTSVAVQQAEELVGFISGYLLPGKPQTLFIWQVAVAERMRGCGLASKMLSHILDRESCQSVRYIETTITEQNKASWALFNRMAKNYKASLSSQALFTKEQEFSGQHETEFLVTIGPIEHTSNATKSSE